MTARLWDAVPPLLSAPQTGAARMAYGATAAALVCLLLAMAGFTSCRNGAAHAWCPDTYSLSFKRSVTRDGL